MEEIREGYRQWDSSKAKEWQGMESEYRRNGVSGFTNHQSLITNHLLRITRYELRNTYFMLHTIYIP